MANMTDQEAIRRHLTYDQTQGRRRLYSTFTGALRDARMATGRDLDTGDSVRQFDGGYWLGSIGYMVLVEQIGVCFRPRGVRAKSSRPFERALDVNAGRNL